MSLKLNLVVNKSGRTLDINKFYYQNEELEIVKRFNNLKFLLSSSFSVKNLIDDLYRRGLTAYFKLRKCLGIIFETM